MNLVSSCWKPVLTCPQHLLPKCRLELMRLAASTAFCWSCCILPVERWWRIQFQAPPGMHCQMLVMSSGRRSSSFKLSLSFTRSRRACCSSSIEERSEISPACREQAFHRVSKADCPTVTHHLLALLSLSQRFLQMLLVHLELLAKVFHMMEISAWSNANDLSNADRDPACSCLLPRNGCNCACISL